MHQQTNEQLVYSESWLKPQNNFKKLLFGGAEDSFKYFFIQRLISVIKRTKYTDNYISENV